MYKKICWLLFFLLLCWIHVVTEEARAATPVGPWPYPPITHEGMAYFYFIRTGNENSSILYSRIHELSEFEGGGIAHEDQTFLYPGDCIFKTEFSNWDFEFELEAVDYEKKQTFSLHPDRSISFFLLNIDARGMPTLESIPESRGSKLLLQCKEAIPFEEKE